MPEHDPRAAVPRPACVEPLECRRLLSLSVFFELVPGNAGSFPAPKVLHEGRLYFTATTTNGAALFRTDGTVAGTQRLGDAVPLGEMVAMGDAVYYRSAGELYRTGGTAGGGLVKNINPNGNADPDLLTAANGTLYFTAVAPPLGRELWKTDGTADGTVPVTDLTPGQGWSSISALAAVGDTLYFRNGSQQLWKTDGTPGGTVLVKHFAGNETMKANPVAADGKLLFVVRDGTTVELWSSDGSSADDDGTRRLATIDDDAGNDMDPLLTAAGGRVFFLGKTADAGVELWSSDGTPEGTVLLKDVFPGDGSSTPQGLYAHGGAIYFSADDGVHGRELWRSDGTPDGTTLLHDVNPGPDGSDPGSFRPFAARLLFVATDAAHGRELRVADAMPGGAVTVVRDVVEGSGSGVFGSGSVEVVGDGRAFFAAAAPLKGIEPWFTDGTPAATEMLELNTQGLGVSSHRTLGVVNGRLLFTTGQNYGVLWSTDGATPQAITDPRLRYLAHPVVVGDLLYFHDNGVLWRSDGTAAGTFPLRDLGNYLDPRNIVPLGGGALVPVHVSSSNRLELWHTDGTPAGTVLVKAFTESGTFSDVAVAGGFAYFLRDNELWRTDGTDQGTIRVRRFGGFGYPPALAALGDAVYFVAADSTASGIWRSDGTPEGTTLYIAGSATDLRNLRALGSRLYYQSGSTLWTSDGVSGSSARKIAGPFTASFPVHGTTIWPLMAWESGLLFDVGLAQRGGGGITQAWAWDGSADGARQVLPDGGIGGYLPDRYDTKPPPPPPMVGGRVYFPRNTYPWGAELWSTDGTPEGTGMVADLNVSPALPGVTAVAGFDGDVYFSADDGVSGRELWRFTPFAERVGDELVVRGSPGADAWTLSADGAALRVTRGIATLPFSAAPIAAVRLEGVDAEDRLAVTGGLGTPLAWDGTMDAIELGDGARAAIARGGAGTRLVSSLTMGADAALDVGDNTLVIENGDAAAVDAFLGSARNAPAGLWTGPGITSSLAAANPLTGLAADQVGDEVVIKYTYNGDANLDGRINADDYFRIDQGFLAQPHGATYFQGDFNFDDRVNADDYFLIDQAFLGQGAPLGGGVDESPLSAGAVTSRSAGDGADRRRAQVRAPAAPRVWEAARRGNGRRVAARAAR